MQDHVLGFEYNLWIEIYLIEIILQVPAIFNIYIYVLWEYSFVLFYIIFKVNNFHNTY